MPYAAIPVRFARAVGWRTAVKVYWDGQCGTGDVHSILQELRRGAGEQPKDALDGWDDWAPGAAQRCGGCGAMPPIDVDRAGTSATVYDTLSGKLEPGCLYWADWIPHSESHCWSGWSNCDGKHLMAVCPNGHHWDIDSRASNCTLPDDHEHRCWIRHGDPEATPPALHVNKDGLTCAAGAGSIVAGDYHAFLHDGWFTAG